VDCGAARPVADVEVGASGNLELSDLEEERVDRGWNRRHAVQCHQAFRAEDGFFTAGVPSPNLWSAFLRVVGLERLEGDPRFTTNAERHANRAQLIPLIEAVTANESRAHWIAAFQEAGVPCGAIQTYDQVFNDPQLAERDFFWDGPHAAIGLVRQLGSPMRLAETPPRRDSAGPTLGQHSAEVLAELGYSTAEFKELRDRSITA